MYMYVPRYKIMQDNLVIDNYRSGKSTRYNAFNQTDIYATSFDSDAYLTGLIPSELEMVVAQLRAIGLLEEGFDYIIEDPVMESDFYKQLAIAHEHTGNAAKAAEFKKRAAALTQ